MKTSCGVIIKYNDKLLLCHPTNAPWSNSYSFPKGEIDQNETLEDCAIRECFEETGIKVSKNDIVNKFTVDYTKGKKILKKVHLFQINIHSLSDINLKSEIVPKDQLQIEEVDCVGFIQRDQIDEKIFWRFKNILEDVFRFA